MPLALLAVCAIKITTIIHYSLNHGFPWNWSLSRYQFIYRKT